MVNSMREAACVYDAEGRFVIVNEFLADWYGTTREPLRDERSQLLPLIREAAVGGPDAGADTVAQTGAGIESDSGTDADARADTDAASGPDCGADPVAAVFAGERAELRG
jgi:PAS domain-containing protein